MKAWHFSNEDCKLNYGDGRLIEVGVTHKVDCTPVLCSQGLHASKKVLDALQYAPSATLWRVELGGKIVCGDDKCVATERTYLQKIDTTDILFKFARLCALDVIDKWDAPDVVVKFLKTGDESLRATARAARAAGATSDATRDAAWDAARGATRDAAWAAAWAAARDAAWDAWDAAREKQNKRLTRMINYAMRKDQ